MTVRPAWRPPCPGLDQALAAVRSGDTLAVPRLDRLARSVPDARHIGDSLVARGIKLSLGGTIYDPADPLGKMFVNILGLPPYMGCGQGKPERGHGLILGSVSAGGVGSCRRGGR